MNIIGEVEGKTCVLIDDMVDTAGTLCQAAQALKDEGAKKVVAYITHPVLSGPAVERIAKSALDELVVTDTIPLREEARSVPQDPPAVASRGCWPRPCAASATRSASARCTSIEGRRVAEARLPERGASTLVAGRAPNC